MKKNIKFLSILILFIVMAMGAVSAEDNTTIDDSSIIAESSEYSVLTKNSATIDDRPTISQSSEYTVSEDNYDEYFDENDHIKDTVVDGDTLVLTGDFNDKNFRINKNITLTSNGVTIYNGTVSLITGASGSTVSNLKIINLGVNDKSGIVLNGITNCYILNNNITCSGQRSITITLTGSNYTVVSDNICVSEYYLVGGNNKSNSGILIEKSSNNNLIVNNYVEMGNANGIYLVKSNNNTVRGNTVNCTANKTDFFCYGIQSTGVNNTYESNKITKTTIGINAGASANASNNIISNVTQSGIAAGANSNVAGNTVVNSTLRDTAITVGENSLVIDNNIDVKGNSKGISANGNAINIFNNTIRTEAGACIVQSSKRSGLVVSDNNITSDSGVGIQAAKSTDIVVIGNNISTSNAYAIDIKAMNSGDYNIRDNSIGSSLMSTAEGDKNPHIFTVDVNNYNDYFDEDGNLRDDVADGYTLILTGDFTGKNFRINKNITFTGENAIIYNGTVSLIIGASGSTVSNLIIVNNGTDINGINLNGVTNCTIMHNNITSTGKNSQPIYLMNANYTVIFNNSIMSKGYIDGMFTRNLDAIYIKDSSYNLFEKNHVDSSNGNGFIIMGTSASNNVLRNNTVRAGSGQAFRLAGKEHTIEFNKVISSSYGINANSKGDIIRNNTISASNTGITTGKDGIITGNTVYGGMTRAGIIPLSNTTVSDNNIDITGRGVGINPSGEKITLIHNNIKTNNGNAIGVTSGPALIVLDNNITSVSGNGVSASSASGIVIMGNNISISDGNYAIDVGKVNNYNIRDNYFNGSSIMKTPDGNKNANIFTVDVNNYDDYFDEDGNLMGDVADGYTLILTGDFTGKNFRINKNITFTGENVIIYNGTVALVTGASGSTVSNLKIINLGCTDTQGIILVGVTNCLIKNNDINCSGTSSFPIALNPGSNDNVISDNILKAGEVSLEGSTKSTSCLVLGGANNNLIKNNYIEVDDANGIYLSAYGSGAFVGGRSNNNIIRNNTVKCMVVPTSWCYGIQLMGSNNTAELNTVIGTFRGISTEDSSTVNNNTLINITGKNFATGELVGGDYAIIVGKNSTVSNNKLINCLVENAGVYASDDTTVKYNDINLKGKGVGVDANGNNVKVMNNNITTVSGNGVSQVGKLTGLVVSNNNITSTSGIGVYVSKSSKTRVPSDITITNNIISTDNEYAINAKDANKDSYTIKDNTVNGSSKIYTPDGEFVPDNSSEFNGKIHDITSDNYHVFFDDNGNLINTDVNEEDVLNFKGEFVEIFPIISKAVKITGDNAVLKNSKITVSSDNVWIENLKIINSNSSHLNNWGIYGYDVENLTIVNNDISVCDPNAAYAIYLNCVFNATVKNNVLYSSGDYLTYTLVGLGLENSVIENNRILTNGTGQHHNYETSHCLDGMNSVNEIYRTYGILLITSSANQIKSNNVTVTSKLNKTILNNGALITNSLVGIDAYFDSSDNVFDGNNVLVYGYDNYEYGMGVLGAQTNSGSDEVSNNNNFTNNNVTVRGNHVSTGLILGYHSENISIKDNNFDIVGNYAAYGITLEYAKNSKVIDNNISLKSNVSYAVEIFDGNDNVIDGNNMTTNGIYGFGVAGYGSNNNKITNNVIHVNSDRNSEISINNYPDALGYGNAGVFFKAGSTGNNISNNNIVSTKCYAVNITGLSGNTVSNNSLKGEKTSGDRAVLGAENNVVENNYIILNGIITNSTFYDYFDQNGMLLSTVTNKTLIFVGEFSNLGVNVITFIDSIRLVSDNAVLNNMTMSIAGNNVVVDGFTFDLENLIEIYGNNVTIMNNKFNSVLVQGKDNILIYASDVNNITIKNNTITFKGNNTDSYVNGVINLENVNNSVVSNNKIDAEIPSAATGYGPGPDYAAKYSAYLIQVKGNNNIISNNDLSLNYSSVLGSYDSLYAIVVSGSNSTVSKNSIKGKGNSYIYGITADGNNVNLTDNNITVFNSNYSANGISLNAPFIGVISNNIVNLTAKSVVYGTNDYGDVHALYDGNKFILNSNSVYGMELMGVDETAINNEIIAKGNYTLGIAIFVIGSVNISNNGIFINGSGLGTPTAGDMIPSMNVAIYLSGSDEATISGNKITAIIPSCAYGTESEAIYATFHEALITGNDINVSVSNRVGDYDSIYGVKIKADDVTFSNNSVIVTGVNYAYGLKATGENMDIDSNNITVINKVNYGAGIDIECPFIGTVNNNIVNVVSNESAYGIYSSQWGSDTVECNYTNNDVSVNGKTAYGFELLGDKEIVSNNDVVANGQYTMGIATNSKEVIIVDNRIISNGTGKTNATTADMFGATNQGILLYDGNVNGTILRNNITTTGDYAVNVLKSENNISVVKDNHLIAATLVGDKAINNITGVIKNPIKTFFSSANKELYLTILSKGYGYRVLLKDEYGNVLANRTVTLYYDGNVYTAKTDSEGIAVFKIKTTTLGSKQASIKFDGDDKYESSNRTVTIEAIKQPSKFSSANKKLYLTMLSKGYGYKVLLKDSKGNVLANRTVTLVYDGKTYTAITDSKGIAVFKIKTTTLGSKQASIKFDGDDKYESSNRTVIIEAIKQPSKITAYEKTFRVKTKVKQYTIALKDNKGKYIYKGTVYLKVNGKTYKAITNSKGRATFKITGLTKAGEFTASIKYNGNNYYSSVSQKAILTTKR